MRSELVESTVIKDIRKRIIVVCQYMLEQVLYRQDFLYKQDFLHHCSCYDNFSDIMRRRYRILRDLDRNMHIAYELLGRLKSVKEKNYFKEFIDEKYFEAVEKLDDEPSAFMHYS